MQLVDGGFTFAKSRDKMRIIADFGPFSSIKRGYLL